MVSHCLLGANVRYDGSNAANRYLIQTLAKRFDLIPICPETGIGLPSPRPPIDLVRSGGKLRAVVADGTGRDLAPRLVRYSKAALKDCGGVCGFILKSKSPSCAALDARIIDGDKTARGPGIFARLAIQRSGAPVIDEKGLAHPRLRREFLLRAREYSQTTDR
jgi:uncharacterized protein YbbK (DUF523 family)